VSLSLGLALGVCCLSMANSAWRVDSAVGSIWLWPFRDGLPIAGIPVMQGHGGSLGHLRERLSMANGRYYRRRVCVLLYLGPAPFLPPPMATSFDSPTSFQITPNDPHPLPPRDPLTVPEYCYTYSTRGDSDLAKNKL
jgi:hypothetical protein